MHEEKSKKRRGPVPSADYPEPFSCSPILVMYKLINANELARSKKTTESTRDNTGLASVGVSPSCLIASIGNNAECDTIIAPHSGIML